MFNPITLVQGKRKGKGGKGMPRWTAYLLWSTRKRRDVVVDHPDWSFAQIAKWISDEWKKVKIYTRIADVPGVDRGELKTLKEKIKSLCNGYKIIFL